MVGSRHEGYGEKGMAHLLEHLVFKGTPSHKDIPNELTERGARANGTTFDLGPNNTLVAESARSFADKFIKPHIMDWDESQHFPKDLFKKAGEFGLMSILMLQNHMTRLITHQKNKEFVSLFSNPVHGKTVVVVGTGSLGGSMAKHVSTLGANIIGVNKRGNKAEGCSKTITIDKIDSVLPEADFLYLALPETPETKNLINKKRLDMLKTTCGVVNIGRQSAMDYDALSEKLKKNEIAGAILDVFSHEPLDKSSKLWDTPNLVITPHVSSDDDGNYVELTLSIFFNNLKLFIENKELSNQVDKKLGY